MTSVDADMFVSFSGAGSTEPIRVDSFTWSDPSVFYDLRRIVAYLQYNGRYLFTAFLTESLRALTTRIAQCRVPVCVVLNSSSDAGGLAAPLSRSLAGARLLSFKSGKLTSRTTGSRLLRRARRQADSPPVSRLRVPCVVSHDCR
jgi:hypothetical protein